MLVDRLVILAFAFLQAKIHARGWFLQDDAEAKFTLDDFRRQLDQFQKMGKKDLPGRMPLPDADAVIIPWGGGGLTCGIAAALRAKKSNCRIYAAEVATAAPLSASLAAGAVQVVDYQPSFVDGIGSKTVFPQMLERARRLIDGALVASLAEVAAAMRLLAERNHTIAEGAGACPVACALAGQAGSGKIACVVSGGNIDLKKLCAVLSQQVS
ncbi:MAG TPA: pyridoxal-phosphate dependent enzyme [Gemmataceae bacterium]|nr:pyridoxal-phosphate dependent enzyme [Gemmataceae bacterium]